MRYSVAVLFVIHAKDKPGSLSIRQANRSAHLDHLVKFDTPVAGPLLNASGEMCGSCIFLEVEDRAAAEAFAKDDPYRHAGLFESVDIHEFKTVAWPS